jgi:hypothetical protein
MDRFTQMILAAARMAEEDSGFEIEPETERTGVSVATGIGGLQSFQDCYDQLLDRGPDRVNPLSIPAIIPNMGAAWVSMDLGERDRHPEALALHKDLLRLRREDPTVRAGRGLAGAVLGPEAFCLRWTEGEPRLLLVNLGADLDLASLPEPLLAPPPRAPWSERFSSEATAYGGSGTPAPDDDARGLYILGHAAVLLGPRSKV